MSVSTTRFLGWIKPKGQPWQSVADGDDEAMCWRRLLEHGELGCAVVLPVGARPDGKRQAQAARPAAPGLFGTEDAGPYGHRAG